MPKSRPKMPAPRRSIGGAMLLAILVAASTTPSAARPAAPDTIPPAMQAGRPSGGTGPGTIPQHAMHNVRGLFSRENLLPLLAGSALTAAGFLLDDETLDFFARQDLEQTGEVGERLGNHYLLIGTFTGLYVAGQVSGNRRFRAMTYDLVQGELVNNAVTFGLKAIVSRKRPNGENSLSFPSGHASNAFTWATILHRHYGWRAGVPAYLTALFIATSRLEEGVHYLSDVLAAATVGIIVGRTVTAGTVEDRGRGARARHPSHLATGPGTSISIRF